MNDLLKLIIEKHGGLDRWNKINQLSSRIMCGGVTWGLKKQQGVLDDIYVAVDTRRQFTSHYPFVEKDWHTSFEPNRVAIENATGKLVEALSDPRSSFEGHTVETPWTQLQLAYFAGYAMWTYFNAPFHFADSGYQLQELDPWHEDGQVFRRLQVTYPESIATHSQVQTYYIDKSGLFARHDYDVDIFGGSGAAHYLSHYVEVQGINIATKRKVYLRSPDNTPLKPNPLLVSIDISEIKLT